MDIQSVKLRFGIIGNAPALNHAIEVAAQVASTDMTVLITGESGSGKESFSKIIHSLSSRKHGDFISINCGAIPEGTIYSELFGHEKGAFTGASEPRKGYFEEVDGGTIFLDEIGEMPLQTQTMLLRVLENGEFIRMGSNKILRTDVRVVAATNVNLEKAVAEGKFRQDLYYRLNTVPIYVPPLRERGEDIYLLFRKFAADFSEKHRVKPIALMPEAKMMLIKFRFPGNIRQLKNLVDQISVLEYERTITPEIFRKYLPKEQTSFLPVLAKEKNTKTDFTERDILYKLLFDMKNDMDELKNLVMMMLKKEGNVKSANHLLQKHSHLFRNMDDFSVSEDTSTNKGLLLNAPTVQEEEYQYEKIEDVTHEEAPREEQEESLSLEDQEKELIIKALKKNNNKRKYAAQNLGISERTLYRKIKQYELENI